MVKIQFIYIIVPVYLIEERYPSGIEGWLKKSQWGSIRWFDEYLLAYTSMVGNDLEDLVEELKKYGIVLNKDDRGVYDKENIECINNNGFSLKETMRKKIPNKQLMKMKRLTLQYGMDRCGMVILEEQDFAYTDVEYFKKQILEEIKVERENEHLSLWQRLLNLFKR